MGDVTPTRHSGGVTIIEQLLQPSPGLTHDIDADLRDVVSLGPATNPLVIAPRLSPPRGVIELADSRRARLRGRVVEVWLSLWAARSGVRPTVKDLLDAAGVSDQYRDVVESFSSLDPDSRARLVADLRSHLSVLDGLLGAPSPTVAIDLDVRRRVVLAHGAGELRVRVDVVVSRQGQRGLLDVTTSPLDHQIEPFALTALADVAVGRRPTRVAQLSTATGDVHWIDVDDALLDLAFTTLRQRSEVA